MKTTTLLLRRALFLCAFLFGIFGVSWGQNAIVGTGFSTGWGGSCGSTGTGNFKYLSAANGSTYILTTVANVAGNSYWRYGIDWGTTTNHWTITPGSDVLVSPNTKYTLTPSCTTSGSLYLNAPNTTDNYVFKTLNAGANPTGSVVFFRIQGAVRNITSLLQPSSSIVPGSSAVISVALDGVLSTGQSAWLRYSTDNFATSSCIKMNFVSGSSYDASIPANINTAGTTVKYYVFTSGDGASISHADADLFTINLNNNSGNNYSYTVASQFYSKSSGSAALQTPSNWGTATDGSGTSPVNFSQNGVTYNISNSATASIGASWTVSGTGSKIVVGDGTNACNFTVPSTFTVTSPTTEVVNNGIITRTTSGGNSWGTLSFASGATYVHNASGGTLPTATWNANSTLQIDANLASDEFAGKTFGNVTINGSAALIMFTSPSSVGSATIAGNLTVNSTGNVIVSNQCSLAATLTINGNFTINSSSGNFYIESVGLCAGSITKKVLVNGDFTLSSGDFDLGFNNSETITATSRYGILEVKGNFTHTGGNITESADDPDYRCQILLSKTSGTQSIESVGNMTGLIEFNVAGSGAQCVVPATKTFVQSGIQPTFVVANGSSSVDLNILGTFRRTSTNAMTINASAVAQCASGSTYEHGVDGGVVPLMTWNSTSTFLVTGITSSTAFSEGAVQSYGNVTWNCPNQTSWFSFGGITTINGNLSIQSTGASPSSLSSLLLTNSPAITTTIAGNLTISGGFFAPFGAATGSSSTLNISGNLSISGGTFDIYRPSSNTGTINLSGNFSMTGGTLTKGGAGTGNFNFSKTGTQTYTKSGGTISNAINFTVNSGSTLSMGTNVLNGSTGTFTLSSGGGIETGHTDGITLTGATGSIQISGTRTYNIGANYTFNGSSAQVTGAGFTGANNLTINNSAGVTLSGNAASLAGTLTLTSGAFTVGSGKTITVSNGGVISRTSGSLAAGSGAGTFTFSGTGTVTGTVGFNNVNIAGGVNFGSSGSSTVNGTLTINSGGYVNTNAPNYASGSTLKYNSGGTYGRGTEWSATSGAGYPHHVQISNTTTLEISNGSNVERKIAGNLIIDANSTFDMQGLTSVSYIVGLDVLGNIDNSGTLVMSTSTERIKCTNFTNNAGSTSTLSSNVGGDLEVTGHLSENGNFNSAQRAVFFTGTGVQDIQGSGTFTIDYIVLNKASGSVRLLSNLLCEGPNGGNAITLTNSTDILDLHIYTLTLGKATVVSTLSGNGSFRGSTNSSISILGDGALGTLRFDQTTPGTTNILQTLTFNRTSTSASGTATLGENLIVSGNLTVTSGTLTLAASKELTVTGTLTNNGTLTLENGATFKQGSSVAVGGTYNVKQTLSNNAGSGSTLTGRFWYMGTPVSCTRAVGFGSAGNLNKVWSFTNGAYAAVADATTLSPTTGYVHRRSDNTTLSFTGTSLYATDVTLSLSNNAGTYGGWHLIANPYTAYLDWSQVYTASHALSAAISPSYYIRSFNSTGNDVNALITYNASTGLESNTSSYSLGSTNSTIAQHIAPMQAIWVKVNPTTPLSATAGQLRLERAFTSHQTGNVGLKNTSVFPTLARVNLVDDARFDQMLVFMNQDMSNAVDQYDSEKMFVSGATQIYTMAAGKKLVMNGLKNNKKKISVPLYLELPTSKVYQLQLSEYIMEDGLIILEDKQEGTMQDFTIHDTYAFYASSGVLSNRFVLHFFMPDATITAQGPSNTWAAEEGSYTEGGQIVIAADGKGKVQITLDQPQTNNVDGSVQAMDANGRVVYTGILEGITTAIQLDVPSGIYYLTVQSGNLIEKKKVFIQE